MVHTRPEPGLAVEAEFEVEAVAFEEIGVRHVSVMVPMALHVTHETSESWSVDVRITVCLRGRPSYWSLARGSD